MIKYKFFTDFDKEEKWLNEMARQGYRFSGKSLGYRYKFAPVEPEHAVIKIDYRNFDKQEDFEDYRALFEDTGWKHVSGTKNSGHQYFRKIDGKSKEEIFSDAFANPKSLYLTPGLWHKTGAEFWWAFKQRPTLTTNTG